MSTFFGSLSSTDCRPPRFILLTGATALFLMLSSRAGKSGRKPQVWQLGRFVGDGAALAAWGSHEGAVLTQEGTTPDGSALFGPCAINCANLVRPGGTGSNAEIYSFHAGRVNAVFGDGSTRFLRAGISISTMAALITRSGGEVLPADAL